MPRYGLHEIGWEMLRRAETHHSHHTVKMIPAVDRGVIFMWACPWAKCGSTAYTYNRHDPPPQCAGGYHWSYTTKPSND